MKVTIGRLHTNDFIDVVFKYVQMLPFSSLMKIDGYN